MTRLTIYGVVEKNEIIGMIAIRNDDYISMLYKKLTGCSEASERI